MGGEDGLESISYIICPKYGAGGIPPPSFLSVDISVPEDIYS